MADYQQVRADYQRYADLIVPLLKLPVEGAFGHETAESISLNRGIVLPGSLIQGSAQGVGLEQSAIDRIWFMANAGALASARVLDPAGGSRSVYTGLLAYAFLAAYGVQFEKLSSTAFGRWDEALRAWGDVIEQRLNLLSLPSETISAAKGDRAVEAAWLALALFVAGKIFVRDAWTDLGSEVFGKIARSQQRSGAIMLESTADHPEIVWYHELVLLQALSSYAVRAGDRNIAKVVSKSAEYHLNETQPDHATHQPWGLFAFIWNPATRSVADQLLHTTATSLARKPDPVSLILLSDALYCLRLFL